MTGSACDWHPLLWLLAVCRGRVLAWEPHTHKARVVASGLYYPDGIAVSEDGTHVLVVETDALRVVKLWLTGDKVSRDSLLPAE